MKPPKEVADKLYDHLNTYEDVHIEIIVRDCAEFASKFPWNTHRDPRAAIKRELLKRYEVEK